MPPEVLQALVAQGIKLAADLIAQAVASGAMTESEADKLWADSRKDWVGAWNEWLAQQAAKAI